MPKFRIPKSSYAFASRRRTFFGHLRHRLPPLAMAYAAYKGVKYLKSIVNVEFKKHDSQATNTPSTSGVISSLAAIAQGDTDQTRSGNSILAKSLYLQYTIKQHASASETFCRLVVFMDKQQISDTAPSIGDILDSTFSSQYWLAPLNNEFGVGRFKVLADRRFAFSGNGKEAHIGKLYLKLKNHIRYNGSTVSDIQKNGIYLLWVSSEATNTPSVEHVARLTFTDN